MEEECDYREAMEQLIRDRKKLCPIKLEFSRLMILLSFTHCVTT